MYIKAGTLHANGSINYARTSQVTAYFDSAGNQLDESIFGSGGGSGGDASAANQTTLNGYVGTLTDTSPASDTASASLNGRLQRVAVNLTAINTLVGAVASTAPATDIASSGLNGRLQRVAQNLTTLNTTLLQTAPAKNAILVTPSDSVDLTNASRSIYVGVAGDVKMTTVGGQTLVWPNLTVGWHPICATRIWATGTVASGIVAVWG